MADKTTDLILKIRERMAERAMSGAPYWSAPVENSARSTAGCLLIGSILKKLPAEDARALCETLEAEQNEDGSWSRSAGEPGNVSLTLEILEALAESHEKAARPAITKSVMWLKDHETKRSLNFDTAVLLRSLMLEQAESRWERVAGPVKRFLQIHFKLRNANYETRPGLVEALRVLSCDCSLAFGRSRRLLELQYVDGSWDGATRSTVMVMAALRHAGLSTEDSAFERGWRFLAAHQAWRSDQLVQNPCDNSNLLHATAVRTLMMTGAEPDMAATSILTLLHQQRTSGGWAMGGLLSTDLLTTALALDALSFAGDIPIETLWARRRAALLLARTQQPDGGWPLLPPSGKKWRVRSTARSRVDVTALAVQALAYSAVSEPELERAIENGVRYLLRVQSRDGWWRGDTRERDIFTTGRAIEALLGAAPDKSRGVVTLGVRALLQRQREDGGWGSTHDTAWVVRALAGMPGVPTDVLKRGRESLESAVNRDQLAWAVNGAELPLPAGEASPGSSDLSTLWALEALAPVSAAAKTRRLAGRKPRVVK